MAEKPMRLVKAANEFNVGTQTIIDFLASKGIEVENRQTKLDADAIAMLRKEFQAEAALKERADQIDIVVRAEKHLLRKRK